MLPASQMRLHEAAALAFVLCLSAPASGQPPLANPISNMAGPVDSTVPGGETDAERAGNPLDRAGRLVRERKLTEAETLLAEWLATKASTRDAALGCVLLGVILNEQNRHEEAVGLLGTCAPPETVRDRYGVTLSESLFALGRAAEAIEPLKQAAGMLDSPLAPRAGFRLGDAYFQAKRWKDAKRQYAAMIRRYPEYPDWAMVHFRLAKSEEELGRRSTAAAHYARLLKKAPAYSHAGRLADEALNALAEDGQRRPRSSFERQFEHAQTLRRQRRWPEALQAFDLLLSRARKSGVKGEIQYHRMRCLESMDEYEKALDALTAARRLGGGSSDLVDAKIRLLRKLGRTEEAVKIVQRRAGKSKKVRALAAAQVWYEDGWYEKAYSLWKRHLRTKGSRDNQWLLAWSAYRAGQYKTAARKFRGLAGARGIRKFKGEYWLARALMKGGEEPEAISIFRDVAERDPVGYYGIQAANRLLDLGADQLYSRVTGVKPEHVPSKALRGEPGGTVRWNGADGADLPKQPRPPEATPELSKAVDAWGDDLVHLPRALDRYRMGLDEAARIELRVARQALKRAKKVRPKRLADRPHPLWFSVSKRKRRGLWGSSVDHKLGLRGKAKRERKRHWQKVREIDSRAQQTIRALLVAVGDPYWKRKRALNRHWRLLKGTPTDDTRAIFAAAYPLAFEETLRSETARYEMSPFFMASIARVESGFNELAVSYAGARGLVQVMPVTGNLIAQRRGDSDFAPSKLLDPRVSLNYGTWYMNELLEKFHGQEPLAIISYNCGPHRVDKWLARRGGTSDTDEFIEEVPYGQSRRYVKSVLRYIGLYRRTYMDRADLYVGQRLDPTFETNINW